MRNYYNIRDWRGRFALSGSASSAVNSIQRSASSAANAAGQRHISVSNKSRVPKTLRGADTAVARAEESLAKAERMARLSRGGTDQLKSGRGRSESISGLSSAYARTQTAYDRAQSARELLNDVRAQRDSLKDVSTPRAKSHVDATDRAATAKVLEAHSKRDARIGDIPEANQTELEAAEERYLKAARTYKLATADLVESSTGPGGAALKAKKRMDEAKADIKRLEAAEARPNGKKSAPSAPSAQSAEKDLDAAVARFNAKDAEVAKAESRLSGGDPRLKALYKERDQLRRDMEKKEATFRDSRDPKVQQREKVEAARRAERQKAAERQQALEDRRAAAARAAERDAWSREESPEVRSLDQIAKDLEAESARKSQFVEAKAASREAQQKRDLAEENRRAQRRIEEIQSGNSDLRYSPESDVKAELKTQQDRLAQVSSTMKEMEAPKVHADSVEFNGKKITASKDGYFYAKNPETGKYVSGKTPEALAAKLPGSGGGAAPSRPAPAARSAAPSTPGEVKVRAGSDGYFYAKDPATGKTVSAKSEERLRAKIGGGTAPAPARTAAPARAPQRASSSHVDATDRAATNKVLQAPQKAPARRTPSRSSQGSMPLSAIISAGQNGFFI